MKGVWVSGKDVKCEIREFEIPKPGDDEVLVRNVAVAANPKDYKIVQRADRVEGIEGSDVAGYVEAVGANVTEFKKGDKVGAMTKPLTQGAKWGAYAEYSIAPAISTFKFDKASFEDIATLPLAVMTSFLCLFHHIGLTPPPEDGSFAPDNGQVVIVNGASSSIGTFAVELAKHAGYKVVGVAGQSGDVARDFGADEVVDYRGKDDAKLQADVEQAVKKLGGKLAGAYDGVSFTNTVLLLAKVLHKFGGGTVAEVLPTDADKNPSILPKGTKAVWTSVFNLYNDTPDLAAKWYRIIGRWVDEGKFKANNVRVVPGGLDGVSEGLDLLKNNKVNAVKLVYRVADSPSLQQG